MSYIVSCGECGTLNKLDPQNLNHAVCGRCKHRLSAEDLRHPLVLSDSNAEKILGAESRPVLVDFWAEWCAPCRKMLPVLEQFAASQDRIAVAKIDTQSNRYFPRQFNVKAIPTLILFEQGREVKRISGAMPLKNLRRQFSPWLS